MSVASTTATIRFIQKSASYQCFLTCDWGDVFQTYNEAGGVTIYFPNFAAMAQADQPVFTMVAKSSRSTGALTLTEVKWYYNDAELFTAADSYSGLFEQVAGESNKIRLKGNPGALSGHPSGTLKCTAKSGVDELEASYPISVSVGSDNLYIVTICSGNAAGNDNHFCITDKISTRSGYSCVLKGKAFKGTTDITSTSYFKWYKADASVAGGWAELGGGSPAATLTITEPDVGVYAQYKCEAYDNSSCSGNPLGFDVQEVLDFSDDVDIEVSYNPASATIVEGDTTQSSVVLTPKVVSKGDRELLPQYSSKKFDFVAKDPSGVAVGQATDAATFTVTLAMCQQCGTDPLVHIDTHDS